MSPRPSKEHYPQLGSVNTPRIRCSCRAENGFEIRYNQFQNWTKVVSPLCSPDAVTWGCGVSRQRHKGGGGANCGAEYGADFFVFQILW